jgi:hypothetical protein
MDKYDLDTIASARSLAAARSPDEIRAFLAKHGSPYADETAFGVLYAAAFGRAQGIIDDLINICVRFD